MKKLFYVLLVISFTFFILNNCTDSSNPTITETEQEQLNVSKKPEKLSPKIELLEIENYQTIKNIPGDSPNNEVVVNYRVINAQAVDYARIAFSHDDDGDGEFSVLFDPEVFQTVVDHDGSSTFYGSFVWDGMVSPEFSSTGIIFDQLVNGTSPDQYLLQFKVSGRNIWLSNIQPEADEMVRIDAEDAPEGSFGINSIVIIDEPIGLAKKPVKNDFVAELFVTVTCSAPGFHGRGKWIAAENDGKIECCPNKGFDDENINSSGSTSTPIRVTKGTYYFVVMTLYSPDYSYDPNQNNGDVLVWSNIEYPGYLDGEPYATITIE